MPARITRNACCVCQEFVGQNRPTRNLPFKECGPALICLNVRMLRAVGFTMKGDCSAREIAR